MVVFDAHENSFLRPFYQIPSSRVLRLAFGVPFPNNCTLPTAIPGGPDRANQVFYGLSIAVTIWDRADLQRSKQSQVSKSPRANSLATTQGQTLVLSQCTAKEAFSI
jgi:hypothetical protein